MAASVCVLPNGRHMGTMDATAVIFPGQGSQRIGMAQDFYRACDSARHAFEEASEASGLDLAGLCFADDLRIAAEFTQPALLTAEVAMFRALRDDMGLHAAFFGGYGLGEYSALVAAGVVPLATAVQIARLRGRLMQCAGPVGGRQDVHIVGALRAALFGIAEVLHPERAGHTTCNATGEFYLEELTSLVEALAVQARGALRWADNMRQLCGAADRIYEVGPSGALSPSFSCLGRRTIPVTSLRDARAEAFS